MMPLSPVEITCGYVIAACASAGSCGLAIGWRNALAGAALDRLKNRSSRPDLSPDPWPAAAPVGVEVFASPLYRTLGLVIVSSGSVAGYAIIQLARIGVARLAP